MDMLDFICMGSADMFGTEREQKIKDQNTCLQWDSNPRHATPHHDRKLSALDHSATALDDDLLFNVLQGNVIQMNKPLRDNTCQIDYCYMCIWTYCQTNISYLNLDFS